MYIIRLILFFILELELLQPLKIMDKSTIKARITQIQSKREMLVRLLETPNLGTLRIDVDQALEELDELIEEFQTTFPEEKLS